MQVRRMLLPNLLAVLALAGCSRPEVVSYRVPKEIEPEIPTAPANAPASTNAPVAPSDSMANSTVPVATGPQLTWTAPASWTLAPAAPMRKATYKIAGPGGAAELSITAFPNSTGGEFANLNRWRGQLHLPAFSETEMNSAVVRTSTHGLDFAVVDFVGDAAAGAAPQRLLGAIVPYAGSTWFFKLTGPDALVAGERTRFQEFLASVQPGPSAP